MWPTPFIVLHRRCPETWIARMSRFNLAMGHIIVLFLLQRTDLRFGQNSTRFRDMTLIFISPSGVRSVYCAVTWNQSHPENMLKRYLIDEVLAALTKWADNR